MCRNEPSAVSEPVPHSNVKALKELGMSLRNAVRAKTVRIAWVMLASMPVSWASTAAHASDHYDATPHKVVKFNDLNLDTPEGAAVLYQRIKLAARQVCDVEESYLPEVTRVCVNDATSRAVAQVNRPMLTSLYKAKTGTRDKQVVTTLAQSH